MSGLMNPENAEKGKGFLEGREVEVLDAGWCQYDADGKWNYPSTCFWMELKAEGLEKNVDQYWSIGKPQDFQPSADGLSVKASKAMSEQCNLYLLATSLINAGVDADVVNSLDENAKLIVGYKFRMGVFIKNKNDKYGTPVVDELLGDAGSSETNAFSAIQGILQANDGAVALKDLPKLLGGVAPDVKKVIMGKGWLEQNYTIKNGAVTA